ncbi:MAG TPA: glycoside hydrolase family 43 protein [Anaeromyxobacter sp.]|nr:glycoside hydrolase family 43 protein [Anaeromyxobacter sp.]
MPALPSRAPAPPAPTFANPILDRGADPWVVFHDGRYVLCQAEGGAIVIRTAARLTDLGRDPGTVVWRPPPGRPYSCELWAPECHFLRGRWFVYVAADDGANEHHRMYVLAGSGPDPRQPFTLEAKLDLRPDRWAIDGTVLALPDGRLYFLWSGWEGTRNVAQNLYVAPMRDPWTIAGPRVLLSRPEHPWERRVRPWVNEGPQILWNGDQLFIVYSASGSWTDDYCLGLLRFRGGDVLDPSAWTKDAAPVFARTDRVFGPGHASFTRSPDGREDWIVYHAARAQGAGWDRRVHAQPFRWNADGSPRFGAPVAPGTPLEVPAEPYLKAAAS